MRLNLGDGGLIEITTPVMEPVEQIMRMFDAHFEDEVGWDAEPMYFYLFTSDADPGGFGAASLPVPPELYEDPSRRLPVLAAVLHMDNEVGQLARRAYQQQLEHVTFYGVGLLVEGWSTPRTLSAEDVAAIEHGVAALPSQRPDRIEVRMVHVATVDGRIAGLTRERGGVPEFVEFGPGIDEDGKDAGTVAVGRIPEALRLLCDGLEQAVRG